MRAVVWPLLLLLAAAPAAAQDTAIVIHPESSSVTLEQMELPRLVADEVIRLYNAATTTRLSGRTVLPKGNEWHGDVAVRTAP